MLTGPSPQWPGPGETARETPLMSRWVIALRLHVVTPTSLVHDK